MTSSCVKQIFGLLLLTFYISVGWASDRPNVVLMLSDNLGYGDLGAYGGGDVRGMPTPYLKIVGQYVESLKEYPNPDTKFSLVNFPR